MASTRTYHVAGRTPGTGPVLVVLADGPADLAVAARAADLAARTGTLLVAAAAVAARSGVSINPLFHRARSGRIDADSRAIVARVTPILHSAGVAYLRTTLPVPEGVDPTRALPVGPVHHLVERFGAVAVVTAVTLHDPTGVLRLAPRTDLHALTEA